MRSWKKEASISTRLISVTGLAPPLHFRGAPAVAKVCGLFFLNVMSKQKSSPVITWKRILNAIVPVMKRKINVMRLLLLPFRYLYVFTYSERDNTKALDIKPVVPINVRNERNKTLRNLSYMKMEYFTQQHRGQKRNVLFEGHSKNGMMEGYTDNYIRVVTPYRKEWANQVVEWTI